MYKNVARMLNPSDVRKQDSAMHKRQKAVQSLMRRKA